LGFPQTLFGLAANTSANPNTQKLFDKRQQRRNLEDANGKTTDDFLQSHRQVFQCEKRVVIQTKAKRSNDQTVAAL
jgi:hypothetical protein